ncbi:MAG: energy-coupling factor transporter transmembrane protein EcfT [Clostridia bacterium]|nr:energy-coupling factor transporter transmembrane protein EcfT [Clostridia bacterium]
MTNLHPLTAFGLFFSVIVLTMLTMHPVLLLTSYFSAVLLCGVLRGARHLLKSLAYSIPVMLMLTLLNPIFVHRGTHILFFLNGNPVTLEAVAYGASSSLMLLSLFYWFQCFGIVITEEKLTYLFGRVSPRLALVLSMSLSLLPCLRRKFLEIDDAQRALGVYGKGGYVDRLRAKLSSLSILLTWALESSVERARSMRARGYGLPGRTAYSLYRRTRRDVVSGVLLLLLFCVTLPLLLSGWATFSYYPTLCSITWSFHFWGAYAPLCMLCAFPLLLEGGERFKWRYWTSKI